jgi:hypothetical protein
MYKVHCASFKLLIISDESNITLCLAETCELKNVNSQKYHSHRIQDTQMKLHSLPSNLVLIINQWE